jgi:hypothetical protein
MARISPLQVNINNHLSNFFYNFHFYTSSCISLWIGLDHDAWVLILIFYSPLKSL